jgi:hypothetical protein
LDLLVRNASAELTTYYYYTILRVNLIGLEGEGLQIAEDARVQAVERIGPQRKNPGLAPRDRGFYLRLCSVH